MKQFVVFLVILIIAGWTIPNLDFMKKTRTGAKQESYKSLTSSNLPEIAAAYIAENNIKIKMYELPNYIKDLFKYNGNFSSIYRSKPKYTIILIAPEVSSKDSINFTSLRDKLESEVKNYPDSFNIIYILEDKNIHYTSPYDTEAVKSLMDHCNQFCLIDPKKNTLFTFKKISMTEINTLPVIIQQYAMLLK